MKMKVSELQGAMLDYWVAKAEGIKDARLSHYTDTTGERCETRYICFVTLTPFMSSSNWAIGGPIIERECISIEVATESVWMAEKWIGEEGTREDKFVSVTGATPLIAAMRCYVESKFGPEVTEE